MEPPTCSKAERNIVDLDTGVILNAGCARRTRPTPRAGGKDIGTVELVEAIRERSLCGTRSRAWGS